MTVFHHVPKPITVTEFAEALRATCPPRYRSARPLSGRRIGLAVSGGVDSMALACLMSLLRRHDPQFMFGDNPCSTVDAYVIDHKLRSGSAAEASFVVAELSRIARITPFQLTINWSKVLSQPSAGEVDVSTLQNMESLARRARYRILGVNCLRRSIHNLFLGHHRDDQYETVLMRLIAGASPRGLVGMRTSNDIPECYDMHGVYQSGFIDEMRRKSKLITFAPRKNDLKFLRGELLRASRAENEATDENDGAADVRLDDYMGSSAWDSTTDEFQLPSPERGSPEILPIDVEGDGIRIYRPLLSFDKDRLRATCESHGVRWVEDPTNHDPTLTQRNAVRHLARTSQLPVALQKPRVLQLARRMQERVAEEDADVDRLLAGPVLEDFQQNIGTAVVNLPDLDDSFLVDQSVDYKRTIAGLLIRRLMMVVSPQFYTPALTTLQGAISRLFPSLATPEEPSLSPTPKPFTVGAVLFIPIKDPPNENATDPLSRWYLSRAPYTSTDPTPSLSHCFLVPGDRTSKSWTLDPTCTSRSWGARSLYDGRFWISLHVIPPGEFTVAPLRPEHVKDFRTALGPRERRRLDSLLRTYAPGKVRFTLPALYYTGTIDLEEKTATFDDSRRMVLALPTLDVALQGLHKWIRCQARYKMVDPDIVRKPSSG